MAHSIVGYHFSTGGTKQGTGAWIENANSKGIPVFLKGVSDYGLLFEAITRGNNHGVNNWLVYRMSKAAGTVSRETPNYTAEPGADARGLADEIIAKLPPEFNKSKVWIEPINEPRGKATTEPVWDNLHPVDYLGGWMLAFASYMNGKGFKVCGPSFNAGEPGDDGAGLADAVNQYGQPGMIDYLGYCADNPTMAALAVHEYVWDLQPPQYPQLWGRFEAAIAAADEAGIPRTFNIFVTEFGYSRASAPTYPAVTPDLDWYNQLAAKFPQLKGAAAWTLQSGYDPVDDQIITWTGYPIDKQFDGGTQPAKTHEAFGGTLPDNTPPPIGDIRSFENGWETLTDRLQRPNDFTLTVIPQGQPLWYPGGDVGIATGTVEAKHLECGKTLPANQCADGSDPLALHGETTYKIQGVTMSAGTQLETVFEGSGRKKITVPVNVHWQKDQPKEADDVILTLTLNGVEVDRLQVPELKDRTWMYLTGEADGPVTATFRYQKSYRDSRDCFTDFWTAEDITMPDETWEQILWDIARSRQLVAFNPKAALQAAMVADGFTIAQTEFDFTRPDGKALKAQLAISQTTGEKRVYYAVVPIWSDVKWFSDPAVSPPAPFEFAAYPVTGRPYIINSPFNAPRSYGPHEGEDVQAFYGDVIVSVAPGTVDSVRAVDPGTGYGIYARVKHNDRYTSWYCHLKQVDVSVGDVVEAGERLGLADSTGNSTGSHLHFTLQDMVNGLDGYVIAKVIDPAPFLAKFTSPSPAGIAMAPYFFPASGDYGPICILVNNWGQGDERQQLQRSGNLSYVTKNQQWERRRADTKGIYFELDTSPGEGQYYTVTGSPWLPNSWAVGSAHTRTETVSFYRKSDCVLTNGPFSWTSVIKFKSHYDTWKSSGNVTLSDVVELAWDIDGSIEETYWYAAGLGLVEWKNKAGRHSWVTEVIPVGQQANNVRETGCYS